MNAMNHVNIAKAKLPASYMDAKAALQACAKEFTPARYWRATIALADCAKIDECATWPQTPETMASYARMADDDSLRRLVRKVERRRAEWLAANPSPPA